MRRRLKSSSFDVCTKLKDKSQCGATGTKLYIYLHLFYLTNDKKRTTNRKRVATDTNRGCKMCILRKIESTDTILAKRGQ